VFTKKKKSIGSAQYLPNIPRRNKNTCKPLLPIPSSTITTLNNTSTLNTHLRPLRIPQIIKSKYDEPVRRLRTDVDAFDGVTIVLVWGAGFSVGIIIGGVGVGFVSGGGVGGE
jgi:hypothetical protein